MNPSRESVVRVLGKRIAPLLVLLAFVCLAGDPRANGVQAGVLFAAGVAIYATIFGASRAISAFPLALLRTLVVWGLCLAAGAGVFASSGRAFAFSSIDFGRLPVSIGGALMHFGAFVAVAAGAALVFLCVAARATPQDGSK
jgi:multicomponent Na+:H+ antiporter subunit B